MAAKTERKLVWSWALYDWANSAFATTVVAVFFPLFFKTYWARDLSAIESTAVLGYANSICSLTLALTSPMFGAMADEGSLRKRMLFFFTLLGIVATAGLALVAQGQWLTAVWAYSLAMFGFTASLTFYDSLLVQIVKPGHFDRVSGFGYALGYLGGGLLLAVNVWMYLRYDAAGVRWSFASVSVWWLVFSLPLFLFVPELRAKKRLGLAQSATRGFKSLKNHILELRGEKKLLYFLIGYLFYIDGVNTIIKMAVDYGLSIGLAAASLIKAILLVQFIGFPSAVAFGYFGEKVGPVRGIWICLATYLGITVFAYFLETSTQFFCVAALIGVVQGGIQALSRSLYARLVPPEKAAEYFGFFNMCGKFSAILGPALVAAVGSAAGNSRAGILILVLFFVAGGYFLNRSQKVRGRA